MRISDQNKFAKYAAIKEYFISVGTNFFSGLELELAGLSGPLTQIGEAFLANLRSVEAVASLPFSMASASSSARLFQRIHIAQRILARDVDATDEVRDEIALAAAQQEYKEEMSSNVGQNERAHETLKDLSHSLSSQTMLSAAHELMRTSVVLLWGAIEVLINDTGEFLLNTKPQLCDVLAANEKFKKRINLKSISFDDLKRFSFDLSGRVGTLVFENSTLDNVVIIRDFFDALDPQNSTLRGLLHSAMFWKMGQQRNLIVHRRAIVDKAYVDATGDNIRIGERLTISPSGLQDYFDISRDIGSCVIKSASSIMTSQPSPISSRQNLP